MDLVMHVSHRVVTRYYIPERSTWCAYSIHSALLIVQPYRCLFSWPMDAQPQARSMLSFRRDQLAFRRAEVYHAVNAMTSLIRNGYNESTGLKTIDDCSIEWSSWSDGSKTKFVECDENVVLAGHSFGGATVVSSRIRLAAFSLIYPSSPFYRMIPQTIRPPYVHIKLLYWTPGSNHFLYRGHI